MSCSRGCSSRVPEQRVVVPTNSNKCCQPATVSCCFHHSHRSSATLELEASTLASTANKLSASSGWDVRALLKHLQSGIKHLEWAHSFAGSGGVGVASISKQQAYKNNLSSAADMVLDCATKTKDAINQDKQRKAQGACGHQGVFVYAFAALRLLADKLYAVAQMNLLFVKTQVGGLGALLGCRHG